MSILFDHDEDPTQKRKKRYSHKQRQSSSKETASNYDDLLVFGYHCKLFRDDAAAEDINRGKYLIPWMGNKDLLIDRYDCRGHLYRLEDFDFKHFPGKTTRLSTEEMDIESVCDEERYKDLTQDMIEANILEEEEEKRSHALYDPNTAYQSIGYSYGESNNDGKTLSEYKFDNETYVQYCQYYGYDPDDPNIKAYFQGQSYQYDYERPPPPPTVLTATENADKSEVELEKFEPPEGLEIPDNIEVPETRKMQSIIEKTAFFISKQSGQMEIVLKTKQSGNPQFAFLNFDNYLNPYYKFILGKIKEGVFKPAEEPAKEELKNQEDSENETSDEDDNDGELHPLLQAHRRPVVKKETSPEPVKNTYIPKTKTTGRVEDLAKVYFSTKYTQNETEQDKKESYDQHYNAPSYPSDNNINYDYNPQADQFQYGHQNPYNEPAPPPPQPYMMTRPEMPHMIPPRPPPPRPMQSEMFAPPQQIDQFPPDPRYLQGGMFQHPTALLRPNPPFQQAIPPAQHVFSSSQLVLLPPGVDVPPGVPIGPMQSPGFNLQRPTLPTYQSTSPVVPRQPYVGGIPGPSANQTQIAHDVQPEFQPIDDVSLLPPGVEVERNSLEQPSLPPPPPLPPPPSIEEIKKQVLHTPASNTSSHQSSEDEVEPDPTPIEKILEKNTRRYEPSPLLSEILQKRSANTSREIVDNDRTEHTSSSSSKDVEQGYVLHPDTYNAYNKRVPEETIEYSSSTDNTNDSPSHFYGYQTEDESRDETQFSVVRKPVLYPTTSKENSPPPIQKTSHAAKTRSKKIKRESSKTQLDSPFDVMQKALKAIQQPVVHTPPQVPTQTKIGEVVPPSSDLQSVIDRLALYVAKNGEEFEAGIKEKNDPRFDFLNPWNIYHNYYLQKKKEDVKGIEKQKKEDEERRKSLKVSFGLKSKVKPAVAAKTKAVAHTAAIFNAHDDEEEEEEDSSESKDGFQPKRETEMKKKLQKQIEEKEKLLRQLQEQALLQHKISEVNRQAGRFSQQALTPQQQAHLKRKLQTDNLKKEDASLKDKRQKKAASFVEMLKQNKFGESASENSADEDATVDDLLRKRHFKETESGADASGSNKKVSYSVPSNKIQISKIY